MSLLQPPPPWESLALRATGQLTHLPPCMGVGGGLEVGVPGSSVLGGNEDLVGLGWGYRGGALPGFQDPATYWC